MNNNEYIKAFNENTKTRKVRDGYSCKCKLGLWAVIAPTRKQALMEGNYYFAQYYGDSEYNEATK